MENSTEIFSFEVEYLKENISAAATAAAAAAAAAAVADEATGASNAAASAPPCSPTCHLSGLIQPVVALRQWRVYRNRLLFSAQIGETDDVCHYRSL